MSGTLLRLIAMNVPLGMIGHLYLLVDNDQTLTSVDRF